MGILNFFKKHKNLFELEIEVEDEKDYLRFYNDMLLLPDGWMAWDSVKESEIKGKIKILEKQIAKLKSIK